MGQPCYRCGGGDGAIRHTRRIRHLDRSDYEDSLDANADLTRRVALEPSESDAPGGPLEEVPLERTMVVLGVSWRSTDPQLRLRRARDEQSQLEPLIGQKLQYRTTGKRVCLGHSPFRNPKIDYLDCLRPPVGGGRRCNRCAAAEATFAASLHHAHTRELSMIDSAVRDHLQQTNLLYLAGFRDGSIKVGTTTESRTQQRLAEQGAWRAEVAAVASDGVAVRQLEDLVTELLEIPQSVSIGRKLHGLAVTSAAEAAERDESLATRLGIAASKVRQIVDHAGDPRLETASIGWIAPSHDHAVWHNVFRYPLALDDGAHHLEVVDAVGRAIAFRRAGARAGGDDDTFVADIGTLFGRVLELGEFDPTEIAVQDSLF